jgi:hypothetical protein
MLKTPPALPRATSSVGTHLLAELRRAVFFLWQNFSKFRPEKYDFDLYKGLFMKKMTQNCQISKKNNSNNQIFMISSIA